MKVTLAKGAVVDCKGCSTAIKLTLLQAEAPCWGSSLGCASPAVVAARGSRKRKLKDIITWRETEHAPWRRHLSSMHYQQCAQSEASHWLTHTSSSSRASSSHSLLPRILGSIVMATNDYHCKIAAGSQVPAVHVQLASNMAGVFVTRGQRLS
mmetsp:Transcript_19443/g.23259  ORF Transcript_19443/g.23259 Transcript_19443/m.23259 type:complete len:153 (-) Transcript_19443:692-1150(-)